MSLQIECQYLQRTVPGVGTLIDPIEYALIEAFFLTLFRREEVNADLREILGHSVKHGGLGIPDPFLLAYCVYNTYKSASEVLVGSLLGSTHRNYIYHKSCVCRSIAEAQKQWEYLEMEILTR